LIAGFPCSFCSCERPCSTVLLRLGCSFIRGGFLSYPSTELGKRSFLERSSRSHHCMIAMWWGEAGRMLCMKYWEVIADNPGKAGWSWDCVSAIDSNGRTMWVAEAHHQADHELPIQIPTRKTNTPPTITSNAAGNAAERRAYRYIPVSNPICATKETLKVLPRSSRPEELVRTRRRRQRCCSYTRSLFGACALGKARSPASRLR
jgi:hypothetical protein